MAEPQRLQNLEFIAGQVQALVALGLLLVKTHPYRERLPRQLGDAEQAAMARAETAQAGDDFLDGIRDVFDRLKA